MLSPTEDTICALATPPGTSGIGMIRLSGPQAFSIADSVTRRHRSVRCRDYQGHTLHRADVVETDGEAIDDVLLGIFHAPRSYTGEDVVEISGHGGVVPLRKILNCLLARGARMAEPGEFTLRAFLNGKMDLAEAEAVADTIAAQTDEAHRLARHQGEGRISQQVHTLRDLLLGILARVEASIDFPEEVGELDLPFCKNELSAASEGISSLLATADRGILYREGLSLVLVGRPNVGKSSLLNALLRTARAIVTPIPGTTRDVVEETMNLHGIPLRAADTAGLRDTGDQVEQLGIARSREKLASADLVLYVMDAAAGETPEDIFLQEELTGRPHLIVWNKWDQAAEADCFQQEDKKHLCVSALTGWNMDALEEAIAEQVLQGLAAPSESQAAVVVTHARHRQALAEALARVHEADTTLESGLPADFLAIDVQAALAALGQITGQTTPESVIAEIFSRFCIGK